MLKISGVSGNVALDTKIILFFHRVTQKKTFLIAKKNLSRGQNFSCEIL